MEKAAFSFIFAPLLAAAVGCSATDPWEIPVRRDPKIAPVRADAGSVVVPPTTTDAAAPTGGGAFEGAPAYSPGIATAQSDHDKHATTSIGGTNPAGRNCLECHVAGGEATDRPWVAAGTVYLADGTSPAPAGVEVRIRGTDGVAVSAYTDVSGNWFIPTTTLAAIPATANVGVRDATRVRTMVSPIVTTGGGACSSPLCHGGPPTPGPGGLVRLY